MTAVESGDPDQRLHVSITQSGKVTISSYEGQWADKPHRITLRADAARALVDMINDRLDQREAEKRWAIERGVRSLMHNDGDLFEEVLENIFKGK